MEHIYTNILQAIFLSYNYSILNTNCSIKQHGQLHVETLLPKMAQQEGKQYKIRLTIMTQNVKIKEKNHDQMAKKAVLIMKL